MKVLEKHRPRVCAFLYFGPKKTTVMKTLYLLIILLSISNLLYSQDISSNDKEQAKQLIIDCFDDIWSDLDSSKVSKYHTGDYLLLENGVVWNNDSVRNYMTQSLKQKVRPKRANDFDFIEVKQLGNSIWLAYHNYATWSVDDKDAGKAHWLESAVAIRTKEGWKLQMLHSTRIRNR